MIIYNTCSLWFSFASSDPSPVCVYQSETSFFTSHLYVFLSASTEWCSLTYFFAFVVMWLWSEGDSFNSLASATNSFRANKKHEYLITTKFSEVVPYISSLIESFGIHFTKFYWTYFDFRKLNHFWNEKCLEIKPPLKKSTVHEWEITPVHFSIYQYKIRIK